MFVVTVDGVKRPTDRHPERRTTSFPPNAEHLRCGVNSRSQLRRRFCGPGWQIAHNGVVFTGASSVAVTRYRYRGANIPTPWTPTANSG